MTRVTHAVLVATLLTVPVLVERAYAHHGAGRYDPRQNVELEGTLTRLDFVNPHSYVYFDVVGADGKVIAMKCETSGGHGAPALGLVAGDVRAGHVHQGDGPPASRRSDCVHSGDVDAWPISRRSSAISS